MHGKVDSLPAPPRLRWITFRNRLVGSTRFQRLAARLPFLRPVARARAASLFDLVAGFVYSQVIAACFRAGWLTRLSEGPAPASVLAAAAELSAPAALRLLRAAAAIGLVEEASPGWWALGDQGAALVAAPGVAAMIEHHCLLYADLADPLELLRDAGDATLGSYWDYAGAEPSRAVTWSALMAASLPMVADQFLNAYRLSRHRRLLDVGGGEGAFLLRVAAAAPKLELALFDLPPVAARAESALEAAGIGKRVAVHAGSFHDGLLPSGFDIVTLVRVLHDHDDVPAEALLRRIRAALAPNARVAIVEPMAGEHRPDRVGDAYFGLYFAAMGRGRCRRPSEIRAMLDRTGFAESWVLRTALPTVAQVVLARA